MGINDTCQVHHYREERFSSLLYNVTYKVKSENEAYNPQTDL